MNNNLSILISSSNSYSDMWKNIETSYDLFWNTHPKIYLLTDKNDEQIQIQSFKYLDYNSEFSSRLKKALEQINTKYVFLSLDDYYPFSQVNYKRIDELIDLMEKDNVDYLRIYNRAKSKKWYDKKNKIRLLDLNQACYQVNLYPSIWKRSSLINLLNILKNEENIWKFEVRLTRRCRTLDYKCIGINHKKVFPFIDVIRKGKYLRKAYKYLKENNLYISDRNKRTIGETVSLWFRTALVCIFPRKFINFLKKFSNQTFYSDFVDNDN